MHLNVIQVAQSLGVEESIVMAWVRHEGLPCVKDGGRLLFDRSQVAAWATERGMAARAGLLAAAPLHENQGELGGMLRLGGIWRDVQPAKIQALLAELMQKLPGASPEVRRMLAQRVMAPNAITWAPVGAGMALPHLRSRVTLGRDSGLIAVLYVPGGLPLSEPPADNIPIDKLVFFMAPTPRAHLEMLARLSGALRGAFGNALRSNAPDQLLFQTLAVRSDPARKEATVS